MFPPFLQQSAIVSVFHISNISVLFSVLIIRYNDERWLYAKIISITEGKLKILLLCEPKSLDERREGAKLSISSKVSVRERHITPWNFKKENVFDSPTRTTPSPTHMFICRTKNS